MRKLYLSNKNDMEFLLEYRKLCLKYKTQISGCGCCGSPFLETDDSITDIKVDEKGLSFTMDNMFDRYVLKENGELEEERW